jgi:hypothetical protein
LTSFNTFWCLTINDTTTGSKYNSSSASVIAFNSTTLAELNKGFLGSKEKTNVPFTTWMGAFTIDGILSSPSNSNMTFYIDMHSGVVIALLQSNSTSKEQMELPSTKAQTSVKVTNYTVTVTETGLPSGITWHFNLSNGASLHSSTTSITFNSANVTYAFTVSNFSAYDTLLW